MTVSRLCASFQPPIQRSYKFEQGDWLAKKKKTFGKRGCCYAFCAIWLRMRRAAQPGEDTFARYVETPDGDEAVMDIFLKQKRNDEKTVENYMTMYGYRQSQEIKNPPGASGLDRTLRAASQPGFFIIGLSSIGVEDDYTGHALAVDSFVPAVFDPNIGQFSMQRGQIVEFLNGLFVFGYRDLSGESMYQKFMK